MNWGVFFAGFVLGGCVGCMVMACVAAANLADCEYDAFHRGLEASRDEHAHCCPEGCEDCAA